MGIKLIIPFLSFGVDWCTMKAHCNDESFQTPAETRQREQCLTRIYTDVESQDSASEK